MKVDPLSFNENRASFSWRAPSLNVLCSPQLWLETSWKVKVPGRMDLSTQLGPMVQMVDGVRTTSNLVGERSILSYAPKVCFSGGDAFLSFLISVLL